MQPRRVSQQGWWPHSSRMMLTKLTMKTMTRSFEAGRSCPWRLVWNLSPCSISHSSYFPALAQTVLDKCFPLRPATCDVRSDIPSYSLDGVSFLELLLISEPVCILYQALDQLKCCQTRPLNIGTFWHQSKKCIPCDSVKRNIQCKLGNDCPFCHHPDHAEDAKRSARPVPPYHTGTSDPNNAVTCLGSRTG